MKEILTVRDDDHIIYLGREYISYRRVEELTKDKFLPVRCEDCENYVLGVCFKADVFSETDPDFFCAWGERRENG